MGVDVRSCDMLDPAALSADVGSPDLFLSCVLGLVYDFLQAEVLVTFGPASCIFAGDA